MKYKIIENELHLIPENKKEIEMNKKINDTDVDGIVIHINKNSD